MIDDKVSLNCLITHRFALTINKEQLFLFYLGVR